MRLTLMLLAVAILQVKATSFAQNVSLKVKGASLEDVFKILRDQSGYNFLYDPDVLNQANKVTLSVNKAPLKEVLDICFKDQPISYVINYHNVVVQKTPPVVAAVATSGEIKAVVITGTVTDSKGQTIPGVTVTLKGTTKGSVADMNGKYSISLPERSGVLVFSSVGFITQEVPIDGRSVINVSLKDQTSSLNEIVVVGYGTQKRINLTGAVAQVSAADIGTHPTANVVNSLQGLLPGLNIQANTGNPGDKPDINIRGFNSLNGGSPLILIDGIQGDIDRVNPLDIESVSILKDAASAAIYGARGAFGVILITTKKGKSGNTTVNYTNNFALTTPVVRTDFISDPYAYGKQVDAALGGYNGTNYTTYTDADYDIERQVADGTIAPYNVKQADGTYKFFGKTNWYDMLFKKWTGSQTHNISISGGNDKVQGYLSGRSYNTQSIQNVQDAGLLKYNIKESLNYKATKWLELSDNMQVSTANQKEFGGTKAGYGGVFSTSTWYFLFPFMPSQVDGVPFDFNGAGELASLANGGNYIKNYSEQFINTFSAHVTPVKDLIFNFDYSNTINHIANTTRLNTFNYLSTAKLTPTVGGLNQLTEERNRNYYNALNIYGTYSKNLFNDTHHFKLLLGYNQEDYNADNILGQQGGLLVSNLSSLNLGTSILQATGSGSIWSVRGYFGRFNYDYKNKYLLEVDGRYDGSSRFPSTSRYGFFPSVSGGWYISRENFFKPLLKTVSSLKLRASYGQLGNQNIDLYTFSQILSTGQSTWLTNGSKLNYTAVPAPLPSVVSWENSKTVDFGGDFGFWEDKLTASFDIYQKDITGMYVPGQPLPAVFGAKEPKENIASLRDRGFELTVGYNTSFNLKGSPFHLKTAINLYNFTGVITKYPNPNGLMSTYYEGQRLGDIYGYHIDGQFQSDAEAQAYQAKFTNPTTTLGQVYNYELNIVQNTQNKGLRAGDIKYVDVNGDGSINKGNNTLANHGDLVNIGNVMPKFPFGINLSADWKNFDFMMAATGVMHQDWYPTGDIYWGTYERPYISFLRKDLITNAWTPSTPNNTYPQIFRGYASLGALRSLGEINDYYLTNVGYLRVKNLTLGYTIPAKLTQKINIQRLRIYFSGENLFTWSFSHLTKYIDPEIAGSGIDYSTPQTVATGSTSNGQPVTARAGESWPLGKIYSLGLSVTL